MSSAKIYRVLKAAGGESTKDLTNYYRVEHAKHLLTGTKNSVQYIADESGFNSAASFFRIFREMTGVTPQEYRRQPVRRIEATGIQGYGRYSVPESQNLLRGYL